MGHFQRFYKAVNQSISELIEKIIHLKIAPPQPTYLLVNQSICILRPPRSTASCDFRGEVKLKKIKILFISQEHTCNIKSLPLT